LAPLQALVAGGLTPADVLIMGMEKERDPLATMVERTALI
jgi:hypothetical protein